MNIENAKKWSAALRSDKYKQCRFTMRNGIGFCCLGVAQDVLLPRYDKRDYSFVQKSLELTSKEMAAFIEMNDDVKLSFIEIADYIDEKIAIKDLPA